LTDDNTEEASKSVTTEENSLVMDDVFSKLLPMQSGAAPTTRNNAINNPDPIRLKTLNRQKVLIEMI
jgi:hypothetical protein